MLFDFLHFVFFQVQNIHYVEISTYVSMEVINWKENKEVGTICFEIKIPMKKNENVYGIFLGKFPKIIIHINNFILEENKNIYGNTLIP